MCRHTVWMWTYVRLLPLDGTYIISIRIMQPIDNIPGGWYQHSIEHLCLASTSIKTPTSKLLPRFTSTAMPAIRWRGPSSAVTSPPSIPTAVSFSFSLLYTKSYSSFTLPSSPSSTLVVVGLRLITAAWSVDPPYRRALFWYLVKSVIPVSVQLASSSAPSPIYT